jgi:hypothetical protein
VGTEGEGLELSREFVTDVDVNTVMSFSWEILEMTEQIAIWQSSTQTFRHFRLDRACVELTGFGMWPVTERINQITWMGGACSTHCAYNKCIKTGHHTKKRDQLGDIGVDGKKTLK